MTGGGGAGGGGGGAPPAPPGSGEPPEYNPGRIPGAETAFIPEGKIDYLLTTDHTAPFFVDRLGFTPRLAAELERQLLYGLPRVPGAPTGHINPEGRPHWVAVVILRGPRRVSGAFTVWQVMEDGRPALVTAYKATAEDDVFFE